MADPRYFTTPQDVADAIRAERAIRRWSQAKLAAQAGVGRKLVIALEAAKPTVELGKALAVLAALDIQPVALPAPRRPVDPGDIDVEAHLARF